MAVDFFSMSFLVKFFAVENFLLWKENQSAYIIISDSVHWSDNVVHSKNRIHPFDELRVGFPLYLCFIALLYSFRVFFFVQFLAKYCCFCWNYNVYILVFVFECITFELHEYIENSNALHPSYHTMLLYFLFRAFKFLFILLNWQMMGYVVVVVVDTADFFSSIFFLVDSSAHTHTHAAHTR